MNTASLYSLTFDGATIHVVPQVVPGRLEREEIQAQGRTAALVLARLNRAITGYPCAPFDHIIVFNPEPS